MSVLGEPLRLRSEWTARAMHYILFIRSIMCHLALANTIFSPVPSIVLKFCRHAIAIFIESCESRQKYHFRTICMVRRRKLLLFTAIDKSDITWQGGGMIKYEVKICLYWFFVSFSTNKPNSSNITPHFIFLGHFSLLIFRSATLKQVPLFYYFSLAFSLISSYRDIFPTELYYAVLIC